MERLIRACDRHGVVVILGLYYQRQSRVLRDEAAVRAGVVNAARWIQSRGFLNVAVEVANEYPHNGFAHALIRDPKGQASLVQLVKETVPGLLVTASGYGDGKVHAEVAEACDFLTPHWNGTKIEDIPARVAWLKRFGKPIVCNEDDRVGERAAAAMNAGVTNGCAYGLMLKEHNQTFPFHFDGAADDPVYYAALKTTTSVKEHAEVTPSQSSIEWTVASPNGAIRATVMLDESHGTGSYRVSSRGVTVIEQSPLGITTSVGDFTRGLVFASNAVQEINETYVLPVGKRSTYVNHANELVLTLRKDQRAVRIHFRAYDDGIAFCCPRRPSCIFRRSQAAPAVVLAHTALAADSQVQWTSVEDTRLPVPPAEHPRLYLRAEQVAKLPARLKHPVLQPAVEQLRDLTRNSPQLRVEWDALQLAPNRGSSRPNYSCCRPEITD